jgi:predicted ArsR family transcriptional regulator
MVDKHDDYIDGIPIEEYRVNMSKISPEELIKLYKDRKMSIHAVAKHFGCTYRTIYRRLERLGIPTNRSEGKTAKGPRNTLKKKELKNLLDNHNLTIDQIAKRLRTTPEIVRRHIEKYGLM